MTFILGIQDAGMGEFIYNFNFATHSYYKDLDRNELLKKAFNTVLEEINDPYTEVLDESFKEEIASHKNVVSNQKKLNANDIKNITTNYFEAKNKKIAYIKMNSFSLNSAQDFKKALEEHESKGFDSLIIDLRDNLGGENGNLVNIASLFLDKSKIICIDKYKDKEITYYSKGDKNADYPIVLLGNYSSASCSEILITALKEGCNATYIGTRTYGKGVGQIVKETPNYYYKVTAFEWLTPSRKSIGGVGIEPDIQVHNYEDKDLQLDAAIEYLQNK